jgi:hypothetical protein
MAPARTHRYIFVRSASGEASPAARDVASWDAAARCSTAAHTAETRKATARRVRDDGGRSCRKTTAHTPRKRGGHTHAHWWRPGDECDIERQRRGRLVRIVHRVHVARHSATTTLRRPRRLHMQIGNHATKPRNERVVRLRVHARRLHRRRGLAPEQAAARVEAAAADLALVQQQLT